MLSAAPVRRAIALVGLVAAFALAAGCGSSGGTPPSSAAATVQPAPTTDLGGVTLRVANGAPWQSQLTAAGLANTPYQVKPVAAPTAKDIAAAFASERADVIIFSDVAFAGYAAADLPVSIVHAIQRPTNVCGVIVPKDSTITSIAQLRGKTVGNGVGQASELVAIRAFQRVGLDFGKDVHRVDLTSPADVQAAFLSGRVDALAACTPPAASLVQEGRARWLANGDNGLWDAHLFWGLSHKVLNDPRKLGAALDYIRRVDRSFVWGNTHNDELVAAQAKTLGIPVAQAKLAYAGRTYGIPITGQVVQSLQATYDSLATLGRIPADKKVAGLFTERFNPNLQA
ncbi:hypothetical protein UK82_29185 [Frankia sp. ACN1ag]|nr:hypothetical protein UK82_29185 [Frankia sp. ACN1ag]